MDHAIAALCGVFLVAALYLLINLPMSFAAKRLEKLKL